MAKITIPNTSGDQNVAATALGDASVVNRWVAIKVTGSSNVHLLRQDAGTAPTCATVIANGFPLVANALAAASGEATSFFDPNSNPTLSRVFAACSSGSSELRIF